MKFDKETLLRNQPTYSALALLQREKGALSSEGLSSSLDRHRSYVRDFLRALREEGIIYEVDDNEVPNRARNSQKYYDLSITGLTAFAIKCINGLKEQRNNSQTTSAELGEFIEQINSGLPEDRQYSMSEEFQQDGELKETLELYFEFYLERIDSSTLGKMIVDDLLGALIAHKSNIESEDLQDFAWRMASILGHKEGVKEFEDALKSSDSFKDPLS